jgi:hypothetical protein
MHCLQVVVELVLATDMKTHFSLLGQFNSSRRRAAANSLSCSLPRRSVPTSQGNGSTSGHRSMRGTRTYSTHARSGSTAHVGTDVSNSVGRSSMDSHRASPPRGDAPSGVHSASLRSGRLQSSHLGPSKISQTGLIVVGWSQQHGTPLPGSREPSVEQVSDALLSGCMDSPGAAIPRQGLPIQGSNAFSSWQEEPDLVRLASSPGQSVRQWQINASCRRMERVSMAGSVIGGSAFGILSDKPHAVQGAAIPSGEGGEGDIDVEEEQQDEELQEELVPLDEAERLLSIQVKRVLAYSYIGLAACRMFCSLSCVGSPHRGSCLHRSPSSARIWATWLRAWTCICVG